MLNYDVVQLPERFELIWMNMSMIFHEDGLMQHRIQNFCSAEKKPGIKLQTVAEVGHLGDYKVDHEHVHISKYEQMNCASEIMSLIYNDQIV